MTMIGDVWQLRRGDEVVADITIDEAYFPWLRGRFTPHEAFADVAPLFAEELALAETLTDHDTDEDIAARDALQERINETLTLVGPSGPTAEFLMHVAEGEAWFRWRDATDDER